MKQKRVTVSSLKRDLAEAQQDQAHAATYGCDTLQSHTDRIFYLISKIREMSASKDPRVLAGRQGTMVDGAS